MCASTMEPEQDNNDNNEDIFDNNEENEPPF